MKKRRLNPEYEKAWYEEHFIWDKRPKWADNIEPRRFQTYEDAVEFQRTRNPALCIPKWIEE